MEIVKTLINAGANINLQNIFKCAPLLHASYNGNLEIVQELIRAGADPTITNSNGESVISISRNNLTWPNKINEYIFEKLKIKNYIKKRMPCLFTRIYR